MTKYLLHQANLTRLTVEIRGKGVGKLRRSAGFELQSKG